MDEPLIQIDGSSERGELPLSFLNLIELRFLASYRQQVSLPAIRRALEYAAGRLGVKRPLLDLRFATEGRELFLEFAEGEGERYFVNASRSGQLAMAWPEDATRLLRSLDYDDDEHAAFRWWPLGREQPVMLDTRLNAGQPSTAHTAVRTIAIAVRKRQGWTDAAIAEDVSVEPAEIEAALTLERAA